MTQTSNTKQAAWIAVGSLCSFGFTIVSSMILSRYFDKADYGTYRQVMYVYNTLLTVFTLGLPKAYSYFLPRVDNAQSKSLIQKLTRLFFFLGGLFSVILFVFASQIALIMNNPELTMALRIFSPVPFLLLPTMGLGGVLVTFKQSKFIALYNILTNIFKLICVALPVIIWRTGYIEALVGFVVASIITFLLALYLQYYPVRGFSNEKCSITYKEIFQFSIPLLLANLWGIIISSSDQLFVSRYFGAEVFADFSNGSIELPFIGMITGACAAVLSPVFSRLSYGNVDPKNEIYPLWINVFEKTAKLIYPLVIYCIVFADVVIVTLYGHKYAASDSYFRIKLITNFFNIIVFAPLLINVGKVKYYSNVHMIVAFLVVILEYISVKLFNSPYAISWVSMLCQVIKAFALLWMVANYFGVKLHQLFPIRLLCLILIPSTLLLLLERWLLMNILGIHVVGVLLISLIVYVLIYFAYSQATKMNYIEIIKPLIKK